MRLTHLQKQYSHQPATKSKELEREGKGCRLVIVESGLRLRRVTNVYVKKYQEVNWMIIN